jgi:uncharacterized protein (DUF1330 family)
MKRHYSVGLAMLVGIVLGSLGMQALKAQRPPSAFYIAEVDVSNASEFATYSAGAPAIFDKYGGRYLVRGGKTETLEGDPPKRVVVVAFKSLAEAKAWWASPEYAALKPIRHRSATTRNFIVEGVGE